MNAKLKHFHVITVVSYTAKYMILLLLPITRALVFTNIGFVQWLKWAWLDVLIILLILAFGVFRFFLSGYILQSKGIVVKNGLFWRKQIFVPYKKTGIFFAETPLFFRMIGASNIYIDTDAGDKKHSDIKIIVKRKEIVAFENKISRVLPTQGSIKNTYHSKTWEVVLLSIVFSNTLAGIVFTATFITFLGKIVGQDLNTVVLNSATKIADILALKIPPIASVTGAVLIGGWAISFLLNMFKNLKFVVCRHGKKVYISSGVFTKRRFLISVKRINYVRITQSVLTKFLKLYSGFIACNGYGKQKNEYPVIIPNGKKKHLKQEITLIFPEVDISENIVKPLKPFLFRFVILPINMILITTTLLIIALYKFKQFSDTVWFIGLMIMLPCIWFLVVKVVAFYHTGIGKNEHNFVLRYTDTFKIYTVLIPKEKIVKIEFSQTLLQKGNDGCDMKIYPFSEGNKPFIVTNMTKKEAKSLFIDVKSQINL